MSDRPASSDRKCFGLAPIDLAEAIHRALVDDDPTAYIEDFDPPERAAVDGKFDFIRVAQRVEKAIQQKSGQRV